MRADVAVESPDSINKSPITFQPLYSEVCFVIVIVKYPEAPTAIESLLFNHVPVYYNPLSAVFACIDIVTINNVNTINMFFFILVIEM